MHIIIVAVVVVFWVTHGSAQGLILALCSEVIPGGAWVTIWEAED